MFEKVFKCATALSVCAFLSTSVLAHPPEEQEKQLGDVKDALEVLKVDLNNVKPDTIVARVGNKAFTAADVFSAMEMTIQAAVQTMGQEAARNLTPEILFFMAREQLIDMYLLENKVESIKERLLKDPAVQEAIEEAKKAVLQQAYVKEEIENYVTKKRIREKYKEMIDLIPKDAEEVRVRMIVVKTEDEAKEIISQLDKNADFLKLAREKSIHEQSAANDGDIGYQNEVEKDLLPAGFEVIFEKKNGKPVIAVGKYTTTAVKSPFGYHILKIEDRRPLKKPKLSEAEPIIKQILQQEAVQKMQEGIKNATGEITRLHPNTGKPMKSLEEELKEIQAKITSALAETDGNGKSKNGK